MQHEKIINLLDNTPNQPTRFRAKHCVETNVSHVKRVTLIVKLDLKHQS